MRNNNGPSRNVRPHTMVLPEKTALLTCNNAYSHRPTACNESLSNHSQFLSAYKIITYRISSDQDKEEEQKELQF